MNGKSRPSVARSVGDVASDVTSLAELQFQLFAVDVAESKKHLAVPLVLLITGLVIALAAGVLSLLVLAACLYEFAQLPISASLGIAMLVGMLLSLGFVTVSIMGLKKSLAFFERSRLELKQNVEWMKGLKQRNRSSYDVGNN